MELKELIKLWKQCEKETREQRLIKEGFLQDVERGYFKLQFADFISWLENKK